MKMIHTIASLATFGIAFSTAMAQVASPTPYTTEYRFPAQDWSEGDDLTPALGASVVRPNDMVFGEGLDFWFTNSADDPDVPAINGVDVDCIAINGSFGPGKGLGIFFVAPNNGEGTPNDIYEYTFVFDVFVPALTAEGLIPLWQGNATNINNAEFFLDTASNGFVQNCNPKENPLGAGSWSRGEWFRVVQVVDYNLGGTTDIYVNGEIAVSGACSADWLWSYYSGNNMLLFTDDDTNAGLAYYSGFALADTMLSPEECAALGAPNAEGIFTGPNPPEETGAFWTIDCSCSELGLIESELYEGSFLGVGTACAETDCPFEGGTTEAPSAYASEWRFDDGTWTIGSPLATAYGTSECVPSLMSFGEGGDFWFDNTADSGLPQIDSADVDYITLNNVWGPEKGLRTILDAPGNGDGVPANIYEFTLIYDLLIPAAGDPPVPAGNYQALWQGNATNSNDAEFFLRCDTQKFYINGCGQAGNDGSWPLNEWFRVVHRVNDNAGVQRSDVFVNGVPVVTNACSPDWLYGVGSGLPIWLLADDTEADVLQFHCANMAFVDVFMDEADIVALGGPNAAGVFSGLPTAKSGASFDTECNCTERTQVESAKNGEVYAGDSTTCADTDCPLPDNNICNGAVLIVSAETPIDTSNAISSGYPIDDSLCPDTFLGAFGADIWFTFIPAAPGLAEISTCDPNGFDTDVFLYTGDSCDNLVGLACNGDATADPACQQYHSFLQWPVEAGLTYYLRVGGYFSSTSGTNLLTINGVEFSTGGVPCPADFNDDGVVNGADFGLLLSAWGPCVGCPEDMNADGEVNGADVGLLLAQWGECPEDPCADLDCDDEDSCTIDYCLDGTCYHTPIDGCFPGCGAPGSGSCDEDNGTPGCEDISCCSYVCNLDPYCCEVTWDGTCSQFAEDCP